MDYPHGFPPALVVWLPVLGSLVASVLSAMVIFHLGQRVLRRATWEAPVAASVAARTRAPAKWSLPVLFVNLVLEGAPEDAIGLASLQRLLALLLIACLTWLVSSAIRGTAQGVIKINPTDVANNLQARRLQTQTLSLIQL